MKLDAGTDLQIRRYLLASLSEEEREQVEARLMADDDYFQQISLVEDELVEEYLDQELDPDERKRFEDTFLRAPERRQKLRFTRALRIHAAKVTEAETTSRVREQHPWRAIVFALFNVPRPVLAGSLVAVLTVMALGSYWALVRMDGLQGQVSRLRTERQNREAVESGLRAQIKQHQDQIAILLHQGQSEGLPEALTAGKQPRFTLSSGMERSAQSSVRCEIPKLADLVWLKLDLAENRKSTYRAVLMGRGREILSRSNLKAAVGEREISISFRVPAADLPDGYCEVRLYGSGEDEPLEIYPFRVIRK